MVEDPLAAITRPVRSIDDGSEARVRWRTGECYRVLWVAAGSSRAAVRPGPTPSRSLGFQSHHGTTSRSVWIQSAPKRVVIKIVPHKVISWDHTKLGGRY